MSNPNIGYLFNKAYYSDDYFVGNCEPETIKNEIKEKNSILLGLSVDDYRSVSGISEVSLGNITLCLKTTYPGLLVGSGYMHEVGTFNQENQNVNPDDNPDSEIFKLGFYFDYTTGLPVIPGSSVKGMLRYAFDHYPYMRNVFVSLGILNRNSKPPDKDVIDQIKKIMFDGQLLKERKSIYERDIFYDSVIKCEEVPNRRILGADYITPHWPNLLKNPIPIKFIKVLPGVTFQFRFTLQDTNLEQISVTKIQKLKIFHRILSDIGIGAKTNLSYGQFDLFSGKDELRQLLDRIENEEHQEKMKDMTDIEKKFYSIERNPSSDRAFAESLSLFKYMKDAIESNEEKKQVAVFLRNTWIKISKWSGQQSTKQKEKVDYVKSILD